jgi:hypothetical protein
MMVRQAQAVKAAVAQGLLEVHLLAVMAVTALQIA